MSLSNCWTQGCKAIFISSVNLCFCSQQQSHTIYKWSKTIEWVNKIKQLKLPEAKVCSRGNNQPVFWITHHILGDWNKSSERSLQERDENSQGHHHPFAERAWAGFCWDSNSHPLYATPTVLAILPPKWGIWFIQESLKASLPTGSRDKYDSHREDVHKTHRPQATYQPVYFRTLWLVIAMTNKINWKIQTTPNHSHSYISKTTC